MMIGNAAQLKHAGAMVEAARQAENKFIQRGYGLGSRQTIGNVVSRQPVYEAYHFRNAAAKTKARRALKRAAQHKGADLSAEEKHVVVSEFVHTIPVHRGVPSRYRREYAQYAERVGSREDAAKKNKEKKHAKPVHSKVS